MKSHEIYMILFSQTFQETECFEVAVDAVGRVGIYFRQAGDIEIVFQIPYLDISAYGIERTAGDEFVTGFLVESAL